MLKKTITFKDLDGNDLTEDFYFHLTKAEITEMELSQKGGLSSYLEQIVKTEDAAELIAIFKDIILKTVGRRSEDGRRFVKNEEIRNDFMQTEAYSELFMELATNTDAATAFMTGLIPAGLEQQVQREIAAKKTEDVQLPQEDVPSEPSWIKENRLPNDAELRDATPEQLRLAFQRKAAQDPGNMPQASA